MDAVADVFARCIGSDAAAQACSEIDDPRDALVTADRRLHGPLRETIASFCPLLSVYREEYVTRTPGRVLVSHTDCPFLVGEFLTSSLDMIDTIDTKRERVLARYRERIGSVIIDEAQDIAELQHASLASLVTSECRVLTAGDIRESIYGFRDVHPSIFQRAAEDGRYFGIDWDSHVTELAAIAFCYTPDATVATNAIAEPALSVSIRGDLGHLNVTFPLLDAPRDSMLEPNVHIAAFDTATQPGTADYVASRDRER